MKLKPSCANWLNDIFKSKRFPDEFYFTRKKNRFHFLYSNCFCHLENFDRGKQRKRAHEPCIRVNTKTYHINKIPFSSI